MEAAAGRARRNGAAVALLGHRDDVADLLRAADLFLLPSSAEGLCSAAIEAQAACLPVVAFRVTGVTETVADGTTGLLVDQEEGPAGLAAAVARLAQDPPLARTMGQRGRERAEVIFSLDNTSRAVDFLCGEERCPEAGHSWEVTVGC